MACVCPQLNVSIAKNINIRASVYTAEWMAIIEVMNIALKHLNKDIHIFSDCLSALQVLNHVHLNMKPNDYIHQIEDKYNEFLLKTDQNHVINFHWVPSHVGIAGNEEADKVVKEATENPESEVSRIPFTDFKEIFQRNTYEPTVQDICEEGMEKGTEHFDDFYKKNKKSWFSKFPKFKREQIVWINRARANHVNTASSLYRINILDSKRCSCEHPEEDLNHIFFEFEGLLQVHYSKKEIDGSSEKMDRVPSAHQLKTCFFGP
ncbi:uncharacterized protein LOC107046089 [Diachasma alloeum]|uniref:uncharacterized protein LOC107046089 n=1 Tax=Diachasma alloeum TaxID=454923 RepID=UPI0007384DDE|nr:uncharacterized protein LOC107046089 [Diachasma alloeum]XP_028982508.1 uncharacterized protein LOC107046089 [Diachasma alloeum]